MVRAMDLRPGRDAPILLLFYIFFFPAILLNFTYYSQNFAHSKTILLNQKHYQKPYYLTYRHITNLYYASAQQTIIKDT